MSNTTSKITDYQVVNLTLKAHQEALFLLMDAYMRDPLGLSQALDNELFKKMYKGLEQQSNYLGIILYEDKSPAGLANCFLGYSTFKAAPLLNIHDFVVVPELRGRGLGHRLMEAVRQEALRLKCCKITLEVRHDNPLAQNLYKKQGFRDYQPPVYFWEYIF